MQDLKIAIENLYDIFSPYTTTGICHCNCGCIDEEDVQKLNSKPLRQLEEDDLISYHGSALYTWGDVQHYKHYLPRICELMSKDKNWVFVNIDELSTKLEYANWTKWPLQEQLAIKDFILAKWTNLVNNHEVEIQVSELSSFGKFYDIESILNSWQVLKNDLALKNFVLFFYYHGNQILNDKLKIENQVYTSSFLKFIKSNNLLNLLELAFFHHVEIEPKYAEKISIVLQIIEQELNAHKLRIEK